MAAIESEEENRDYLKKFTKALRKQRMDKIEAFLLDMHPAEIAHLLESLPSDQREIIWPHIPVEAEGEVLLHLNDNVRAAFIEKMDPDALVAATETLDEDDLADLFPEMPRDVVQELLLSMEQQDRDRLKAVLYYPEDTAGGLMDLDTVTVRADITLDVVLRYLRRRGEIPPSTDSLFVVDRDGHYLGLLPLTALLTHEPAATVHEVMEHDENAIPADMPEREVANLFQHRDLITAPVVSDDNVLLGRITIDDVVDVIRDDADHSLMSMAGLDEEMDMFAPVVTSAKRRAVWLGVNLLTALLASWVIGMFQSTIQQFVALAILMPIVASMGGIAGTQTLTLVIRGIALGQISASNARQLFTKELWVGVWNGLIWAIILAAIAGIWFNSLSLSLLMAAAIVINLIVAAIAGATVPLLLRRVGIDPALAGSVVLTTITDVMGFFAFLGLASIFLV
ncbi:MAG TPA: magnesium transporter [Gammaproteobacteria bacterium]|nr:magnesium transporter [Gammaproteobacteria bacterium]